MIRLASALLLIGAALALAACGGGSNAASGAASGGSGATVSVASVNGVGNALVDSNRMTLYTSEVEAGGQIRCTGTCNSFWKPLKPGAGKPSGAGDTGKLGVIKRPDGTRQVTSNGAPLYTFAEDGPGDAKGDGFTDDFAGRHFVWHAVGAGGKTTAGGSSSSGGGGYSSGGGY